jgi:hypothetical protein
MTVWNRMEGVAGNAALAAGDGLHFAAVTRATVALRGVAITVRALPPS